ncbi:unnamed protein product [Caenorhabditis brenneri]
MKLLLIILALFALHDSLETGEGYPEKKQITWQLFREYRTKSLLEHGRMMISIEASLTCKTRENFCATVYYTEEDYFPVDDQLALVPLHCSHTNTLNHSVTLLLEEGDGFLDKYYELAIRIHHDCPGVGKHKEIYISWQTVKVNNEGVSLFRTYEIDLTSDMYKEPKEKTSLLYASESWGMTEDPITKNWAAGKDVTAQNSLYEVPRLYWTPVDFPNNDWFNKLCLVDLHQKQLMCYFSRLPMVNFLFVRPKQYNCEECGKY